MPEKLPNAPEEIQQVVRSMTVSLRPPDELYDEFLHQKTPSILRFYLGVKGNESNPRYTLLGGKIDRGENWHEAIQREVTEEAGLKLFGINQQTVIGSWKYSCPVSGPRQIVLTYNPVLSCSQKTVGDPKITSIATLSLAEFKLLVENGQLNNIPIEGHLTIGGNISDQIETASEEGQKKDRSLIKGLGWMMHLEEHLQKKFASIISGDGRIISEEEFKREYEKLLSGYMRKGLNAGIAEKKGGRVKRHELIEAIDSGFLGKDILYYLPELAKFGVAWPGLSETTESVKIFVGFLKSVFGEFLKANGFTELSYRDMMQDPKVSLDNKKSMLNSLDQYFKRNLRITFNVDNDNLAEVAEYIQNFFRYLSNEMKVADPNLTKGLEQDFTLLNEVNNANFGYLLSLFLGVDTKKNLPEADCLIRFEAGRQLLLLLKGLSGIKYYKAHVNGIRNGRFQTAVNNFFGSVSSEKTVDLDGEREMKVRIRQQDGQRVIVDEKPVKTFTSFLRKSFEEKIADIRDFHTISVTFVEEVEDGKKRVEALIADFSRFIRDNFPNFPLLAEKRNDYGTADYMARKDEDREVKGIRKGSQGSKFVRTKLNFTLGKEDLELVIYPYYSLPDEHGNFWGWLETRKDDKDYVVRRLLAGEHGIPSTYDLLFPTELYPYHFRHKLKSSYHR